MRPNPTILADVQGLVGELVRRRMLVEVALMLTPVADPLERSLPAPLLVSLLTGVVQRGHTFRFRAGGGSMFPFIRDGDILSIVPLSADRPARLGDVLAFDRGGGDYAHLVVHRW
jgi:hypothetical protein